MDQIVRYYTSKKFLRYDMIEIAALNSYTTSTLIKHNDSEGKVNHVRRLILKKLAKQLVIPNMKRRKEFLCIRRPTVEAMDRCALRFGHTTASAGYTKLSKKKRCYFYNHSKDRMVKLLLLVLLQTSLQ